MFGKDKDKNKNSNSMDPLTIASLGLQGANILGNFIGSFNAQDEQRKRRRELEEQVKKQIDAYNDAASRLEGQGNEIYSQAAQNRNIGKAAVDQQAQNNSALLATNTNNTIGQGARAANIAAGATKNIGAVANANDQINQTYLNNRNRGADYLTKASQQRAVAQNLATDLAKGKLGSESGVLRARDNAFASGLSDLGSGLLARQSYLDAAKLGNRGDNVALKGSNILNQIRGAAAQQVKPSSSNNITGWHSDWEDEFNNGGKAGEKEDKTKKVKPNNKSFNKDIYNRSSNNAEGYEDGGMMIEDGMDDDYNNYYNQYFSDGGMPTGGRVPMPTGELAEEGVLHGDITNGKVVQNNGEEHEVILEPNEVILSNPDQEFISGDVNIHDTNVDSKVLQEIGKRYLEVMRKYERDQSADSIRGDDEGNIKEAMPEEMVGVSESEQMPDMGRQVAKNAYDTGFNAETDHDDSLVNPLQLLKELASNKPINYLSIKIKPAGASDKKRVFV